MRLPFYVMGVFFETLRSFSNEKYYDFQFRIVNPPPVFVFYGAGSVLVDLLQIRLGYAKNGVPPKAELHSYLYHPGECPHLQKEILYCACVMRSNKRQGRN